MKGVFGSGEQEEWREGGKARGSQGEIYFQVLIEGKKKRRLEKRVMDRREGGLEKEVVNKVKGKAG